MTSELPKTFDPAAIEARWYAHWENEGLFRPERPHAQPFTIVNPPPNVTGSLHIGHALDNTLQDIVIRYERLRGKDALWVVGTDHAGIATQMVVERQMNAKGQKRTDFTREEFIAKVWEWKEESGGQITRQLRRLGASMDWANERFTMDEGFSKAVIKVFVELYNRGLLYRDKRLVNWDPHFRTAISDLEVETKEVQGKFWHFQYPLEDGSGHISVATTRPETMLADMAVAVNPEDERYLSLIGKNVRLPITGRLVPIVADEHADPELGSGAVKITPGHDFNDFEVGKRAGFKPAEMLNMLDADAKVVQCGGIPEELLGLDRFEARKIVVGMIEDAGLLEQIEDRTIQTPYGDRSGAVIEPWLTDQWYVDAETLAKPAIEAVKSGKIEIVPKTWEKTYFNWMENIQPWCVSRQLWWGHRIPAWYGPAMQEGEALNNVKPFVAETAEEALAQARTYYQSFKMEPVFAGESQITDSDARVVLHRDSDVLDTWFSSALWPFGTLGWPDAAEKPLPFRGGVGVGPVPTGDSPQMTAPTPSPSPEGEGSMLARHYPNDLLISGFDILFFWDARMIMQGLEFMKEVPFHRLYLHGLVRAADGSKMSKSKGNTVDPLGLIDKYGADALRFFMAAMESQGRDIKMDEKRVEGYRNFATKLWNAARFCQANGIGASHRLRAPDADLPVNRWIIAETVATVQALDLAMAELRFDAAANAIYHFVWDRFCDWYLELIKPLLNPPRDGEVAADASASDDGGGSPPAPHQGESPLHRPADGPPPRAGEDLETRAVAGWVLDQILVMLHPFMPFVTEELWHAMGKRDGELIVAHWPQPDAHALDRAASEEIDWLIRLVSGVRTARAELNVPPGAKTRLICDTTSAELETRIINNFASIARLARIETISFPDERHFSYVSTGQVETVSLPSAITVARTASIQVIVDSVLYIIPLEGVIDLASEKARLAKAMDAAIKERDALAKRLENPAFVQRAKPEAVEKAREDFADKSAEAERLQAALERLG